MITGVGLCIRKDDTQLENKLYDHQTIDETEHARMALTVPGSLQGEAVVMTTINAHCQRTPNIGHRIPGVQWMPSNVCLHACHIKCFDPNSIGRVDDLTKNKLQSVLVRPLSKHDSTGESSATPNIGCRIPGVQLMLSSNVSACQPH